MRATYEYSPPGMANEFAIFIETIRVQCRNPTSEHLLKLHDADNAKIKSRKRPPNSHRKLKFKDAFSKIKSWGIINIVLVEDCSLGKLKHMHM